MDKPAESAAVPNVEQLLKLHSLTREVSKACQKQLRAYLDTIALLLRPRRILGEAMEGGEREFVAGSERTVADLRELYKSAAVRPFNLRPELAFPLEAVSTQLQLHEWEYFHIAKTDRGSKPIVVTTPLTWVITYSSPMTLSMIRQVAGGQEGDPEAVRAFVLRACILHFQFAKLPAIAELLAGLRYRVEVRRSPETGDLPLVTVSAPITTIRPPDDLVNMASGLAGGASFAEVLDLNSIKTMLDPFRSEVSAILRSHGQEI